MNEDQIKQEEEDVLALLVEPAPVQPRAIAVIERLRAQRDELVADSYRVPQAREALERYRDGLKHGEQAYDDLKEAMEVLGSPVTTWRIRRRKQKSRAELMLRIDGLMDNLDEIHRLVGRMMSDPNATPQAKTNARQTLNLIEKAQEEARADIERCGAQVTSIPAGESSPVTDSCVLEEGHEGNHRGKAIEWPQEAVAVTA